MVQYKGMKKQHFIMPEHGFSHAISAEEVIFSPVFVCCCYFFILFFFFFGLFIFQQDYTNNTKPIWTHHGGGMGHGPGKNPLYIGAEPDHLLLNSFFP